MSDPSLHPTYARVRGLATFLAAADHPGLFGEITVVVSGIVAATRRLSEAYPTLPNRTDEAQRRYMAARQALLNAVATAPESQLEADAQRVAAETLFPIMVQRLVEWQEAIAGVP